jgi:hypothetical protein
MLALLGLRIFEATSADIADLGEEHGHRVLRVCGNGTKIVLIPLPPAVGRAIDRAVSARTHGPILLNSRGTRMDRHAATRLLRRLTETAGVRITRPHPHMLRHTFVTTMLDAGVDLRAVQIAARHADPRTTMRHDKARELHQPGEVREVCPGNKRGQWRADAQTHSLVTWHYALPRPSDARSARQPGKIMWTDGPSRPRWHFQRQSVLVAPTCGFADQRVLKSISEEQAPAGER